MSSYTTIQGDTWDIIAKKKLGSEKLMHHLIDANPEYANVMIFVNGVTLTIPEIETSFFDESLPPWER